jgi:hypothetical protein
MDLLIRRNPLPAWHQKFSSITKMRGLHPQGRWAAFCRPADAGLHRFFVAGLLLLTGFRLLALVALPLDLSGDEAYYANTRIPKVVFPPARPASAMSHAMPGGSL